MNVIDGVGPMASMACGACYVADDGVGGVRCLVIGRRSR
jgi:hypothetical protein